MRELNKTNLLNKLRKILGNQKNLDNQVKKVPGKASQGGKINPASSVNPDRTLWVRLGSLRWLNFPSPGALVGGVLGAWERKF